MLFILSRLLFFPPCPALSSVSQDSRLSCIYDAGKPLVFNQGRADARITVQVTSLNMHAVFGGVAQTADGGEGGIKASPRTRGYRFPSAGLESVRVWLWFGPTFPPAYLRFATETRCILVNDYDSLCDSSPPPRPVRRRYACFGFGSIPTCVPPRSCFIFRFSCAVGVSEHVVGLPPRNFLPTCSMLLSRSCTA